MRLNQLNNALYAAFMSKLAVELQGPPGCGKSQAMEQFAEWLSKKLGSPVGLITEHLSRMESIDLGGIPHKMEDKDGKIITTYSMPPVFPTQYRLGTEVPKYGILFLDEFGQAGNDVKKAAARLLEERRLGSYSLDDFGHWVVFAASNRAKDRSGVGKEMAFLQNRKAVINIEPDLNSWVHWAESRNIHPLFIAFAKANPGLVFKDEIPLEDGPFTTPRTLIKTHDYMKAMAKVQPEAAASHHGLPLEDSNTLEFAAGLLGEATAATLMAFVRMADALPSFEEIVESPTTAQVPGVDRADAIYAISQTCAHRVTGDTALAVFQYIQRLPEEHQIATLRIAARKTPEILHNTEFTAWIRKNRRLLTALTAASVNA